MALTGPEPIRAPGFELRVRQTPTLGPAGGLPVRIRVARDPREH